MIRTAPVCIRFSILLTGLTLLLGVAASHAVPFGIYPGASFSPRITAEQVTPHMIRLSLSMENLPPSGPIDLRYPLPGTWGRMIPSERLLPRFTVFVALPNTGNPTVTVENWSNTTFSATATTFTDNSPQPPSVTLGQVGILGGVRIVSVTFRPVTYVNSAANCQVVVTATVRIDVDDQTGENPVTVPRASFSRPWQKLLQAMVVNWEDIPDFRTTSDSHILMIVPDVGSSNYIPGIQPYIGWKEQRGVHVTMVPRSTIAVRPTADQLRNYILNALNTSAPPIDFVVLVGDETQLAIQYQYTDDPPTRFSSQSFPGIFTDENYFAALRGSDVFPDLFVARWVVSSNEEAAKIARRSVLHEQNPFMTDSLRFQKAVMVSDMQTVEQRETKRKVRSQLLNHGFTAVDTVWGDGISPQALINRINNGRAFVNYRGTGWSDGWAGINFWVDNIEQLTNGSRLPIVTGIGCGVGIFNVSDNAAFGEAFMLAGSVAEPKGAVGFIGPCWNTHTVFNDCLDSSLYAAWLEHDALQLQPGLVAGKMMVWGILSIFLGDGSVEEITETMFRQYHVQGDPSLQVYTQMPVRLQVWTPPVVGTIPFDLYVGVGNMAAVTADSLNVTAWMGMGNFVSRWIVPPANSVSLPVDPAGADSVVVTVTGDNVLAYQVKIPTSADVPEAGSELPAEFELNQNYPNPFNAETVISFAVPHASRVTLEVFDLLGRRITTLVNGSVSPGYHSVVWNGSAESGLPAGSGLYFYRLTTEHGVFTRKLMLLK